MPKVNKPAAIYSLPFAHSKEWMRLWRLPGEQGHLAEKLAHLILERHSPYCIWVRFGANETMPSVLPRMNFERRMKGQVLMDGTLKKPVRKMEVTLSSRHLALWHRSFEARGGGTSAEFMRFLASHLEASARLHKAHFLRQSRIEED